jgi:hypothetical protein
MFKMLMSVPRSKRKYFNLEEFISAPIASTQIRMISRSFVAVHTHKRLYPPALSTGADVKKDTGGRAINLLINDVCQLQGRFTQIINLGLGAREWMTS